MNKITIINAEWNCYNGFIFELIHLELFKPIDIDNALFGLNVSKNFLYIDILWMQIKVFDKTDAK
jgi:hypothetical protein